MKRIVKRTCYFCGRVDLERKNRTSNKNMIPIIHFCSSECKKKHKKRLKELYKEKIINAIIYK